MATVPPKPGRTNGSADQDRQYLLDNHCRTPADSLHFLVFGLLIRREPIPGITMPFAYKQRWEEGEGRKNQNYVEARLHTPLIFTRFLYHYKGIRY